MGIHKSQETQLLYDDDLPYGLFMKADFCTDHDLGCRPLLEMFGVKDPDNHSTVMDDYLAMRMPEYTRIEYEGSTAYLLITQKKRNGPVSPRELRHWGIDWEGGISLISAWDEANLIIAARGTVCTFLLNTIYNAICTLQVYLFRGSLEQDGRHGLTLIFDRTMRRNQDQYRVLRDENLRDAS